MLAIGGGIAAYASVLSQRWWGHTAQPPTYQHTLRIWLLGGIGLVALGLLIAIWRWLRLLGAFSALAGLGMLYVTGADMVRSLLDTRHQIALHTGQLWAVQIVGALVVLGASLACLGRDPRHPHA